MFGFTFALIINLQDEKHDVRQTNATLLLCWTLSTLINTMNAKKTSNYRPRKELVKDAISFPKYMSGGC